MKYCDQCGFKLEDDATLCPNCKVEIKVKNAKEEIKEKEEPIKEKKEYVRPRWHITLCFIDNVLLSFSVFFILLTFTNLHLRGVINPWNIDASPYRLSTAALAFSVFYFVMSFTIMIIYICAVRNKKREITYRQILRTFIALLLLILTATIKDWLNVYPFYL